MYLLGLQFTVVTDCNALRTTFMKKDLIPRIGRWWLEVQDFTLDIEHRFGTKMQHVDAFSRNPVETIKIYPVDITEADWILATQLQDKQISRIRIILMDGVRNNDTKQYFADYTLRNDKLYRRLGKGQSTWVVPRAARFQICRLYHDDAGHLGLEKTLRRIRENYWFAGMTPFVRKYIGAFF